MKKKTQLFLGLASMAVLAACGNQQQASETTATADVTKSNFPVSVTNEGTPIEGGIIKYALISDSPISGVLSSTYYENAPDGEVISMFDESLIATDSDYKFTTGGIGEMSIDPDNKTVTVSIRKDVKWSDGEPLTIDDYIYAFEVIAHKDYTGTRYSSNIKNIEGVEEYHSGAASSISGITKNDDYSVTFKLKTVTPSVQQGGGFWNYAMPKHVFKDIPVADQAASNAARTNPVGLGAFRVTKVTSGESVTLEANPYYWQGKPKVDGMVIDVVNSTNSPDEFAAGKYDIMSVSNSTAIYDSFKNMTNGTLVGQWQNALSYIGFKLGTWDSASGTAITNPSAKMANKSLRQAMGYAVNMDEFAESFYDQLRVRANSLIVPTFSKLRDSSLVGYDYQPEKAKQLLDDAGYKDVDGDGYREDPNGNPLVINFAFMSGGDGETQAQYYLKAWKEVGLNVQLTGGRLLEFNTFYKQVEADDANIDVYSAAWSVGGNPNPTNLWGNSKSNYTRYTSTEHQALLDKLNSNDMFDEEKQVAAYKEWQEFVNEEAFAIPTLYRTALTAVNKRVSSYDITPGGLSEWHKIQLLADSPYANQ